MKAHLAKVSLALLSAVFLLGCQEQASSPVGLEGPQFDKKGDPGICPGGTKAEGPFRDDKGHCHGEDAAAEEDGQTVTVILTGGMEGKLEFVKVFSDNGKKFAMNTIAESKGEIVMNFDVATGDCTEPDDADDDAAVTRLKLQLLSGQVIDVPSSLFSLFNVKVDRTTLGLPDEKGNDLQVTYDPNDGFGGVILGWAHRDRATVSENKDNGEFTFSGGQIRVGEEDGRPRDRIRILCPSADVTVTVTR